VPFHTLPPQRHSERSEESSMSPVAAGFFAALSMTLFSLP
jgi:hypothetical protein